MKALFRNRLFWQVLGAILLGLLIWFIGPMIAIADWRPLGWWPVTLFFALLPLLVMGGLWWWGLRKAKAGKATSWLLHMAYWHLPSTVTGIQHVPPSHLRLMAG